MSSTPAAASSTQSGSTSFKFLTNEQPQPQLYTDVQNLNAFGNEQLTEFTKITLSFLAQQEDSRSRMEAFAAAQGVNLRALENTVQGILYFFSEALKRSLKQDDVKSDLEKLGLESARAELLAQSYQREFATLSSTLVSSTFKVNQLVDMEWKFGVTAGTSELSEVGTCFLQVKLVLNRNGKKENVLFEMSLPQFYSFLANMQKAALAIDQA